MPQAPRELTPSLSPEHSLGAHLRQWRTARKLSQRKLGLLTHHSGALIGRFEKAERRMSERSASSLDQALRAGGRIIWAWSDADDWRELRAAAAAGDRRATAP